MTELAEKAYVTKNVVLYPPDVEAIESVRERMGLPPVNGFSAALRVIIREWREMNYARFERGEGDPSPTLPAGREGASVVEVG